MNKKRIMPLVLSVAMGSQPIAVLANEINDINSSQDTGKLKIDMNLTMPDKDAAFDITLNGNGQSFESTLNSNSLSTEIQNIPAGEYELKITAPTYVTYTKKITIDKSYITTLSLDNSRNNYTNGKENQKSVMAIGDITGDGLIDEKDEQELINAIENGSTDKKYDFNDDGKVDVTDLSYIAINKGGNIYTEPYKTVDPSAVTINNETSKVEGAEANSGSIEGILTGKEEKLSLQSTETISTEKPVTVDIELTNEIQSDGIVIAPPSDSSAIMTDGSIVVEDINGNKYTAQVVSAQKGMTLLSNGGATATIEADGSIVINVGQQVPIKKVTINVTGSTSDNLVDIGKVEFVNGMENRIPAPNLNIPKITEIKQIADDRFRVTWDKQTNVTGYEVSVAESSSPDKKVIPVNENTIEIYDVKEKVTTYIPYTVMVRSVNGEWKSPYSEPQTITLKPTAVPAKPESVTVTGGTESINVSWKKMEHTQYYNIYYKEENAQEYTVIKNITSTSHIIPNLTPNKTYHIYITGVNEIGESEKSDIVSATVTSSEAVILPKYKLINTGSTPGVLTDNIKSVTNSTNELVTVVGGDNATVDNDPSTYVFVDHYDGGVFYKEPMGPIIEFTQKYTFDTIRFAPHPNYTPYDTAKVRYKDDQGTFVNAEVKSLSKKFDSNGSIYYDVKLKQPITTDTFQLSLGIWYPGCKVAISEIKVYEYDSIENDVNNLFADEMHLSLKPEVNESQLKALEDRINTKDDVSGEYHPYREGLLKEIEAARKLLDGTASSQIFNVNTSITANNDKHLDFAMTLSDLQPLGITAMEGEKITLYVGSPGVPDGTPVDLKLYATQVHGESSKWLQDLGQLKTGKNEITIDSPSDTTKERGGSLYVAYTGAKNAKQYSIRLGNERNMPVLDITRDDLTIIKETNAVPQKVIDYVAALEKHVNTLEQQHNEKHTNHEYDPKNCTLNVTDIVMNNMMYSFPATQVLAGLKGSTTEEKAKNLYNALQTMEQQVDLFYQHKGLNKNSTDTNRYPSQRLNIRYSTMFAGAFMYAGGKHIGIEYTEVPGLFGLTPVVADENGKYISGNFTGWGVAHEIGHVINSNKYTHAEVTNNYFSLLSQSKDSNNTARVPYDKVYEHVTSGKKGNPSDVFAQLGMYWQLHMFYDDYYNYKTFDTHKEQLDNLFYARVDSYVRNPGSAPHSLSLNSDPNNNFMRLACAAANKNLLPFFEAWGLTPNAETIEYANNFEAETKKIQYLDDDSRAYRLEGGSGMSAGTKATAEATYAGNKTKEVNISLGNTNANENAMLGYEIIRNGQVVAFVPATQDSYTDIIKTENNRVFEYQVIAYDRLLNATDITNAGAVKVSHDGSIGKDGWIAETNMTSNDDVEIKPGDDTGHCEPGVESAIKNIIDDNYSNEYTGKTNDGKDAEIIVDFNGNEQVTAFKYKTSSPTTDNYSIYISNDKSNWELVKEGTFSGKEEETIYFNKENDPLMYIYDASYIKIVINNTTVTLSEIDVLGPTGDNVDFFGQKNSIGTLSEDFVYGSNPDEVMKAGSIVVTGEYKGNPAYNVVLLKDENGKILNGEQVILAEVPENGNIGEVSSGTFVYKLTDTENLPKQIKAELYRVDDAITLEGQRLVSDTLYINFPEELPPLTIESAVKPQIPPVQELPEELPPETDNPEGTIPEDGNGENNPGETTPEDGDEGNNPGETTPEDGNEGNNPETEQPSNPEENQPDDTVTEPENGDNSEENTQQPSENKTVYDITSEIEVTPNVNIDTQVIENIKNSNIYDEENDLLFVANNNDVTLSSNISLGQSENNKNQATVKLTNTGGDTFIAIQTQIKVSNASKINSVSVDWNKNLENVALKEYKFNKEKGTISLYVVSNDLLSNGEDFEFGTITIKSKSASKQQFDLDVDTSKTVLVSNSFTSKNGEDVASKVTVETYPRDTSGGSSGESSGENSGSSENENTKPEEKPEVPTEPETPTEPEVTPPSKPEASTVFIDVNKNSWYYNSVNKAYQNNWFAGVTENTFAPDSNMTRAMLVTVLGRFDNAVITPSTTQFVDVPADMYYANYVAWAKNNGIVSGITETTFEPNTDITREQLAVMICNYLKFKNVDLTNAVNTTPFTDSANISPWAVESVNTMKALGIINGRTDGSFDPKGTATRAEIATILSFIDDMQLIK